MDIGATGRFVGFWAVLVTGFSYQTELVGVGAYMDIETANPRKAIPQAIRWTAGFFSLFMATVFFVAGCFCLFSSSATRAGVKVPFINAVLLSGSQDAAASTLVVYSSSAGIMYTLLAVSCSVMGLIAYINLSSSGATGVQLASQRQFHASSWVLSSAISAPPEDHARATEFPASVPPRSSPPYLSSTAAFFA
ncbi:hypothetical protein CEK25_006562 [Fusarium fujikuroi]|nr:hypothetical protein CEK25_006562 [Fusarium fujikuroi]